MKPLAETRGVRFELMRHFLAHIFESEMFPRASAGSGGWLRVAISALSMAIPAGMLLMDPPYYHQPVDPTPETLRAIAIADQLAILTLVFAVTGIVALLAWQSLFPSRRDYLALAGLPVRSRQIFGARFASTAIMGAALTLVMTLLPSFMAPHHFTAATETEVRLILKVIARCASSGLGCLFLFFAIVALQGLLLNGLPARLFPRASTWVQGGLMALFVLGGLYSWAIVDWRQDMIAALARFGGWAPPVWFAGLYQTLLGDRDPFFAAMARRALVALLASLLLAALTYALAYRRYRTLLLESADALPPRHAGRWSFANLLTLSFRGSEPRRDAILEFMAKTIGRSRMHRLVVLAYLGAAFGVMVNSALVAGVATGWSGGWIGLVRFICLYWPLGLTFITLAGLRHAFRLPVELPANWMFRITESQGRRYWLSAVERFVIGAVILPVHALALPVAAAVLGFPIALRMTVLELLVSLTAFELLFYSWQQLPFTCSYVPGQRSLVSVMGAWFAVLVVIVPVLSRTIAAMSQFNGLFLFFGALFAAAWIWARKERRDGWGESRLLYEDLAESGPHLGISEMSHRWIANQGTPAR